MQCHHRKRKMALPAQHRRMSLGEGIDRSTEGIIKVFSLIIINVPCLDARMYDQDEKRYFRYSII